MTDERPMLTWDGPEPGVLLPPPSEQARVALQMIREAIELEGPIGVLPSREAVLELYGPTFEHDVHALVDAVARMGQAVAAERRKVVEECAAIADAAVGDCWDQEVHAEGIAAAIRALAPSTAPTD